MKTPRMVLIAIVSLALLPAGAGALLAETRMEESRRLEPGGQFVLNADAGSVELVGPAKSGARIVITSKDDKLAENFDIRIEESAGMVKVTAKKKGSGWFSWGSVQAPTFKIEVPTSTALQIETGGGHLEIASIRGPADLRTSGGHVGVETSRGSSSPRPPGATSASRGSRATRASRPREGTSTARS